MSGLKNTVRRMANASRGLGYKTSGEKKRSDAAKHEAAEQARLDEIYSGAQMPDEELIRRNERRKAAKRRGSRISTVLTDEDQLG